MTEHPALPCPECTGTMTLRPSKFGLFYGCTNFPACRATHGAHPDGRPLGVPANKATKLARIRAHDAFDAFWRRSKMRRKQAYKWLAESMEIERSEAHIGMFNIEQCDRLVDLIEMAPAPVVSNENGTVCRRCGQTWPPFERVETCDRCDTGRALQPRRARRRARQKRAAMKMAGSESGQRTSALRSRGR